MRMMAVVGALVVLAMGSGQAHAQVFDQSFEQFRAALDRKIRGDTTDKSVSDGNTTKQCRKVGNVYTCSFNDKGFQRSIAEFKKLDLMNGRFTLKMTLTVETNGGKVSSIRLNGDRSDPVNLLQFFGTATNIMQVFEPGIVDEDAKLLALDRELGLTRGDADPTTGQPMVVIKPYAAITCLVVPSSITTGQVCEWVPRS